MAAGRCWTPGLQQSPDLPQPHQQRLQDSGPQDAGGPAGTSNQTLGNMSMEGREGRAIFVRGDQGDYMKTVFLSSPQFVAFAC